MDSSSFARGIEYYPWLKAFF